MESIEQNLNDIAGVRVICSLPVGYLPARRRLFLKQDDITLLQRKDYIAEPKPNGYRSLHLIVETPIFLHDQKRMMRVEVQFRTISMDWWASLEHKIRYKKDLPELDHVNRELFECAQMSAQLDARMEKAPASRRDRRRGAAHRQPMGRAPVRSASCAERRTPARQRLHTRFPFHKPARLPCRSRGALLFVIAYIAGRRLHRRL